MTTSFKLVSGFDPDSFNLAASAFLTANYGTALLAKATWLSREMSA